MTHEFSREELVEKLENLKDNHPVDPPSYYGEYWQEEPWVEGFDAGIDSVLELLNKQVEEKEWKKDEAKRKIRLTPQQRLQERLDEKLAELWKVQASHRENMKRGQYTPERLKHYVVKQDWDEHVEKEKKLTKQVRALRKKVAAVE